MTIQTEIKKHLDTIKSQLQTISLIPDSFDTRQAPMGIDRDLLDEITSEYERGEFNRSMSEYLDYFKDVDITLLEYIKVFSEEMKGLQFLQYTNPKSVLSIMDVIGSKGVLNTDNGLKLYEQGLELNKTEWLVKNNDVLTVITSTDKDDYDIFIKNI